MTTPPIPHLPGLSLPPRLRAGDAHAWGVQTKLAAGFSLFYILTAVVNNVVTQINIGGAGVAVDATGLASFTLPSTTTKAWAPAKYQWILFSVDSNGNREELAQDEIRITPDPAATNPVDPRTFNEKVLYSIRCVIKGTVTDDVQMYKIGGRELTKMPRMDLLRQEAIFENRVRNERIRRGERVKSNTIGIAFGGRGQF